MGVAGLLLVILDTAAPASATVQMAPTPLHVASVLASEPVVYDYDYRPDFARPPPVGSVLDEHDILSDPAGERSRVRRAFSGLGADRVAPSGLADDIIRRADANLTGSGETVLGHYADDYIGLAQSRGASYFDIGDAYNGLTPAQQWAANQRVLDTAIANGDRITLATNRLNIRPGSPLAAEIEYLSGPAGGYRWLNNTTLVPGG